MSSKTNTNEPSPALEPSALPKLQRRRVQQLSNEVGRIAGSLVGCGLIGWSCYNLVANFRFLNVAETDGLSFGLAIGVVVLFSLVPFGVGVGLVVKSIK